MDDGILQFNYVELSYRYLARYLYRLTTFKALPSKVSLFLDNSSYKSENIVSSSFDDGSGMFCKAIAPAHSPDGCAPVLTSTGYRKTPAS